MVLVPLGTRWLTPWVSLPRSLAKARFQIATSRPFTKFLYSSVSPMVLRACLIRWSSFSIRAGDGGARYYKELVVGTMTRGTTGGDDCLVSSYVALARDA